MSAQLACHGRLGADPQQRTSQSGTDWATCSIAVNLENGDQDGPPQWFQIVAFAKVADTLCKHAKGDLISVSGRLQLNRWRSQDGQDHERLQIVADTVISARSVRPGGGRKREAADAAN